MDEQNVTKCLVEFQNCLIFQNLTFLIDGHTKIRSPGKLQEVVTLLEATGTHYNTKYLTFDSYLG